MYIYIYIYIYFYIYYNYKMFQHTYGYNNFLVFTILFVTNLNDYKFINDIIINSESDIIMCYIYEYNNNDEV